MLNIGLIGDIKLLDPYITRIRKNPKLHISGKSSVGIRVNPDDFSLSIPEFNRIELIERSDILLISLFPLFPFHLVKKLIKKGKHIFAADHPGFDPDEYGELVKLSDEAGISFHITNPLVNLPAMQWLIDTINAPAWMDISYFRKKDRDNDPLLELLLMIHKITGISPKKIEAVSFQSNNGETDFNNLRLEYSSSTVINLNFGKGYSDEFVVKAYSADKNALLDFDNNKFLFNNKVPGLNPYFRQDEFNTFIENILNKKGPSTSIADYLNVLQTHLQIKSKLSQFSSI